MTSIICLQMPNNVIFWFYCNNIFKCELSIAEMNVFELTGTTLSVIFAAVSTAVSIAVAAKATVILLIASPPAGG